MHRRGLLAALAGLAASAGCLSDPLAPSGPRNPPTGEAPPEPGTERAGLRLATFDFLEADDGRLLVTATVENRADDPRSGEVVATARTPEETYVERAEVAVDGGASTTVELRFDVAFDEFAADGSLDVEVS